MKFSYLLYDPVADIAELDRRMAAIAALGYQGIELSATYPLGFTIDAARDLAARHKLPIVSLLSGWSYAAEGLSLCSPNAAVRDGAVLRLSAYAEWAGELGAILVMGLMQGLRSDEPDAGMARPRIVAGLKMAAASAREAGTMIVVEPVNHLQVGFHHTADQVQALVEEVDSSALGYMLDTIHMHIEERSITDTIRKHGPRIRHFHLCETNGGPFGTGCLAFERVLGTLAESGYDHYVSIKIYRDLDLEDGAATAAVFLRQLGFSLR